MNVHTHTEKAHAICLKTTIMPTVQSLDLSSLGEALARAFRILHLNGSSPKLGVPFPGVLVIRILLFRVLY